MIKDAEESSKIDKEKKEKIDIRNEADLVCYQNEKQLKEYETKVSEEKKESVLTTIKSIREILQKDDFDNQELKSKMEELKKVSQMMQEEIANPSSSEPNIQQQQTNPGDTVIDTDFVDDND